MAKGRVLATHLECERLPALTWVRAYVTEHEAMRVTSFMYKLQGPCFNKDSISQQSLQSGSALGWQISRGDYRRILT